MIIDKINALEVDHEEEDSYKTCITQLIDTSIKDVTNNKNTLVSKMESVISLIREVECQEKAADEAKEEAARSNLDILVKLDQSKKALRDTQETNDILLTKLCVQKAVLATKMETFRLRASHLLDDGDRFFKVLDEMSRSLDTRLTSALTKKELATKKKQETDAFARAAIACEEIEMQKVEAETRSLQKEAVDISMLLELLMERDHALDKLHGEISDNCGNMKQLKEKVDHGTSVGGIISMLSDSYSYLQSFELDENKNVDLEADPDIVIASEVCRNSTCARTGKSLYGYQKFGKRVKKVKIKGFQVVPKRKRKAGADDFEEFYDMVVLSVLLLLIIVIFLLEVFHVPIAV